MIRTPGRTALAGLAALALTVSAVGPCLCFLNVAACHREVPEADAHACCEKPAGVQAVADECCDTSPTLVLASTEVPEVTPPILRTSPIEDVPSAEKSTLVAVVTASSSASLDRTTVLLI